MKCVQCGKEFPCPGKYFRAYCTVRCRRDATKTRQRDGKLAKDARERRCKSSVGVKKAAKKPKPR